VIVALCYSIALVPSLRNALVYIGFIDAGDLFVDYLSVDAPIIVRKHFDAYDGPVLLSLRANVPALRPPWRYLDAAPGSLSAYSTRARFGRSLWERRSSTVALVAVI